MTGTQHCVHTLVRLILVIGTQYKTDTSDRHTIQCTCIHKTDTDRHRCVGITVTLTLIVKAINAVDTGTLMIAPKEEEVFWILYFVRQ